MWFAVCLNDAKDGRKKKSSPHQSKLVRDPSVWGKLGTKAQRRKQLVAVVVLDDLSDSSQCHGVVIQLVWAHVMERGGLRRVAWDPNGSNTAKHTSASNCNYACSPWALSHIKIREEGSGWTGVKTQTESFSYTNISPRLSCTEGRNNLTGCLKPQRVV